MALQFPPIPAGIPHTENHLPDTPFREYATSPSQRIAGWSGEKQAVFLQAIAEGLTPDQACRLVGLSKQSAYAFRLSRKGTQFAIGWQAALLHARDTLADSLMERALHGVVDTITRADGSEIERHRHDNRLGMAMLARLDRMADKAAKETTHAAARLAAEDFAGYVELIAQEAGPARAALLLAHGIGPASEDDLAPLRTLARADTWLRTHTDLAEPIADLDPAARGDWSGADWNRAEAAGLVAIAPLPAPEASQENQDFPEAVEDEPVWWDEDNESWRTHFPPPADFLGEEEGEYGAGDYARELSPEEEEAVEAADRAEIEARRCAETEARDRWFAALLAPPADAGPGPAAEAS
ncbi:hypothetical protein P6144_17095 [Sphingomonas sp. HITSZ_GF]|uniref:hypothetical protein n=1 Tax=Sphingomonas sp. HITSZ_GF TaxID=3037247 RepID=UPI00240E4E0B|nr:hypothetical protein [Sphingomonas sp. HITSZ_GF]MDG2535380.1 hypothetical protein [Sphingomonas sp. HITSZ_GF]